MPWNHFAGMSKFDLGSVQRYLNRYGLLFPMLKLFRLAAPHGTTLGNITPGEMGGIRRDRIYGHFDCPNAICVLIKGNAEHPAFLKDEIADIAVGYPPASHWLRPRYQVWRVVKALQTPRYTSWQRLLGVSNLNEAF